MTDSDNTGRRNPTALRVYRVARGLRQEDLADLSRVARNTIVALEKGEQKPHLATAERIARALGAEVSEVFPTETGGSLGD